MTSKCADLLTGFGIPKLDGTVVRPNGDVVSVSFGIGPADTGNIVFRSIEGEQMLDATGGGIPQIQALPKRHGQDVVLAPTNEIEVVVVDQLGSVKDAGGIGRYATTNLLCYRAQSNIGHCHGIERCITGPQEATGRGATRGSVEDVELIM